MDEAPKLSLKRLLEPFRVPAARRPNRKGWLPDFSADVYAPTAGAFRRLSDRLGPQAGVEEVHDLRVQGRRLIEQVEMVSPMIAAKRSRVDRRWIEARISLLSSVRNADVSRAILRETARAPDLASSEKLALRALDARLRLRRARRLKRALGDLHKGKLRKRLARLAKLLRKLASREKARREFPPALARHAARRALQARRRLEALSEFSSDEELHSLRMALRRLRYAGEAARRLAGRPGVDDLARLRGLQRRLGDHHDLAILLRRIRKAKESLAGPDEALAEGLERLDARYTARLTEDAMDLRVLLASGDAVR